MTQNVNRVSNAGTVIRNQDGNRVIDSESRSVARHASSTAAQSNRDAVAAPRAASGIPRSDLEARIEALEQQVATERKERIQDKEAARQATENRLMFNVIDIQFGHKADLIIRKDRPYSQQEFSRRTEANFLGIDVYVLSPEDSILSKLEWSKGRQSEAQFKDALGVLITQKDTLDFEYLKKWAKELGIDETLRNLLNELRNA